MAVLFDPTDEYVCSVLDQAKIHGEITLADLESILESRLAGRTGISTEDIADTIEALANMGIEIDDDLTQEHKDAEFHQAMQDWTAQGNVLPSLTAEGMTMLMRALERENSGIVVSPEDVAERRKILSERTFIQTMFADLGPRVRRTRKR